MSELAVLVLSCDKYSDLWSPFFAFFHKYWSDCPFPVYLCSDSKKINDPKVISIAPGKNMEWSERFLWALDHIQEKHILLLLEDYLLIKKAHSDRIYRLLEIAKKTESACLKVFPCPGPDIPHPEFKEVGIINKGSDYRISTTAAIWDKNELKKILLPHESVWDFEIKGTVRSNSSDKVFLAVHRDERFGTLEEGDYAYTFFCTAVYRGNWMRDAVKLCRKEGVPIDLVSRRSETRWEEFYRNFYFSSPVFIRHILDFTRSRLFRK